jgi:putative SOS response-associated peptidase YedK
VKQPYTIQRRDGTTGLWEAWRPSQDKDWLLTCTIITCEPNESLSQIHNRIPVILPEEYFQRWLSGAMGKEILTPYPSDLMSAYPISTRVDSPANNDAGIVERVDAGLQVPKLEGGNGLLL